MGFSGGERKFSEIIQIISLNSKFVIFDGIDAGLNTVNLETKLRATMESETKIGRYLRINCENFKQHSHLPDY